MMTRKDYVEIAKIMHSVKPDVSEQYYDEWVKWVQEMAYMLNDDNPRFLLNRFYVACGLETQ